MILITCSVEATCTSTRSLKCFCVIFFTRSSKLEEDTLANENEGLKAIEKPPPWTSVR
jgi:hypothetical protein